MHNAGIISRRGESAVGVSRATPLSSRTNRSNKELAFSRSGVNKAVGIVLPGFGVAINYSAFLQRAGAEIRRIRLKKQNIFFR